MTFCSLESLQGFLTVQIVSPFLVIVLGEVGCEGGLQAEICRGS